MNDMMIRETLHALAGGANLSSRWRVNSNDAAGEYRMGVLNQYFMDAINMLSPLVDGYRPGNLDYADIKKSEEELV
jgi:hypothetical protein